MIFKVFLFRPYAFLHYSLYLTLHHRLPLNYILMILQTNFDSSLDYCTDRIRPIRVSKSLTPVRLTKYNQMGLVFLWSVWSVKNSAYINSGIVQRRWVNIKCSGARIGDIYSKVLIIYACVAYPAINKYTFFRLWSCPSPNRPITNDQTAVNFTFHFHSLASNYSSITWKNDQSVTS